LAAGEILFHDGSPRSLYRVEDGAICHYVHGKTDCRDEEERQADVIEHIFPGDFVGLGYLATHITMARAMVASKVSIVSADELDAELALNDQLALRMAASAEREFECLRRRALRRERPSLEARLACYLVAISSMNAAEGRDHAIIAGEVSSGYMAELLEVSIDALAASLVSLAMRGLISPSEGGLRINDFSALERLGATT
jgi:CRP/FNR family transcriptional regulator